MFTLYIHVLIVFLVIDTVTVFVLAFPFESFNLDISNNGPVVLDAPIKVTVKITNEEGQPATGTFVYKWEDVNHPSQKGESRKISSSSYSWLLVYPSTNYAEGNYSVSVKVYKVLILEFEDFIGTANTSFAISEYLIGEVIASQTGVPTISSKFLSSKNLTRCSVKLHDPNNFLASAQEIFYYWLLNEENYGRTREPFRYFNITSRGDNVIVVFVMAKFFQSADENSSPQLMYDKTGHFRKVFQVKDPIMNVNVSGGTWLKHGEILKLELLCNGSSPWSYCVQIKKGGYNFTGNETCGSAPVITNTCEFHVLHYFRDSGTHTVLAIINNDVSHWVQPVAINVYNVDRKAQLSVIIVPVTACAFAVIAIVFGVAHVVRSKNRFIEVADFDFSQMDSGEYRTFTGRLRESISAHLPQVTVFTRSHRSFGTLEET